MPSVPNSGPAAPPPPTWDARPTGNQSAGYGGFWIRVVAYLVDGIVLGTAFGVVGTVLGIKITPVGFSTSFSVTGPATLTGDNHWEFLSLVATWLYFALMESSPRGATIGKMAVGLRVVEEQGGRISFLRATGRFFAKFISVIILFVGFLMVAFSDRKRGLHDMIAGTLVVKVR